MINLPANIPKHLRETFSRVLENRSLQEILDEVCEGVRSLFRASSAILHYERINSAGDLIIDEHFTSVGELFSKDTSNRLLTEWVETGIHESAKKDLLSRLASISHSSYSWPYPSVAEAGSERTVFPAGYTILVPYSSSLVVRREGDANFFGYAALFFDSFPDLDEEIIGLIISLPSFLSEFSSALLRHFEATTVQGNALAHDFKQHVLLTRQLIYRAQDSMKRGGDDVPGILRRMDASSSRMLTLTSQVLLADRDYSGTLKVRCIDVDLNHLVEEVLEEVLPRFELRDVSLSSSFEQSLPEINLDPAIFPSVLNNLLDNALKYSKKGGRVEISTSMVDNSHVVIEIRDDGIGIPKGDRDKIFKKHFRSENTKEKGGNGLGLYLVRKIVESHNGTIDLIDDTTGQTVFRIVLPLKVSLASLNKEKGND